MAEDVWSSHLAATAARAVNVAQATAVASPVLCAASGVDVPFERVERLSADPLSALVGRREREVDVVALVSPGSEMFAPVVRVQCVSGEFGSWALSGGGLLVERDECPFSVLVGVLRRVLGLSSDVEVLFPVREWALSRWAQTVVAAMGVLEWDNLDGLFREVLGVAPQRLLSADATPLGWLLAESLDDADQAVSWDAARLAAIASPGVPVADRSLFEWCDGALFHALYTRRFDWSDMVAACLANPAALPHLGEIRSLWSSLSSDG